MKTVLFVASHLCSGSNELISVLNENERIQINTTKLVYEHPSVLDNLFSLGHKLDNSAAIYGSQLLYNTSLSCNAFYDFSKFIYVVTPAKPTLNRIKKELEEYTELSACRYYCFRLRRLYEMARHTPGAVFLTGDDLKNKNGSNLIDEYLNLKTPTDFGNLSMVEPETDDFDTSLLEEAQDSYEKYLYRFNRLDLRRYET